MPQASAREIVRALKGRWGRNSGTCKCPAHDDRSPSLSVSVNTGGLVLVHCFAGCPQLSVISALQRLGLWGEAGAMQDRSAPWNYVSRERPADDLERRSQAREIWDKSKPAQCTLVETYLRSRGIRGPVSDQIRYHPSLRAGHNGSKTYWPALVARLSDNRGFVCIQRTYLAKDGSGKAPIKGNKRTLGGMGAGAVRLKPLGPSGYLGLAEGLETAISASRLYSIPVWACLGAYRLSQVELPPNLKSLTIFGDAGDVGRTESFKAAEKYEHAGIATDVVFPAAHFGKADDFNSALRASA